MRILIADDSDDLRELLADLLEANGHTVVSARDGEEALRTYLGGAWSAQASTPHDTGAFDYVITDYQMPRKNGVVLIMGIRKVNPAQKVILVSGDPPQITEAIRKDAGEFPILQKPYRNAELLDLLK